jgi:malonate transporter
MNLIHSLTIIFGIISIGVFCGKKKLFHEVHIEGFELFLFKIALPCYLFSAILSNNFESLVNLPYVFCYLLSFLSVGLITTLYFFRKHSLSSTCIKILASGYVNTAIYSLPVITFLLNDPKAAVLSNLLQVVIIQSSFLIILSLSQHREQSLRQRLSNSLLTPLIILPIISILLSYYQITPHFIITTITKNLGNGASSIALFIFGLALSHINLKKEHFNKTLCFLVLIKNIFHPVIAFLLGKYIFHLEQYWLYSMVISASSPTAFIIYIIAKQFSTDTQLVKLMVAISSVVSLIFLIFISSFITAGP